MCKKAFTLAEVLITIGIIGVVTALTISNLISESRKKVTVGKVQKAMSLWNNAYRLSANEMGEPDENDLKTLSASAVWQKYYARYFNGSICQNHCNYRGQPFKYINGGVTGFSVHPIVNIVINSSDGFLYLFQSIGGSGQLEHQGVFLDINGTAPPNVLGLDVFTFVPRKNDAYVPSCWDKADDYINKDCSKTGQGGCCAEKIRRAGWRIEKDYPWK